MQFNSKRNSVQAPGVFPALIYTPGGPTWLRGIVLGITRGQFQQCFSSGAGAVSHQHSFEPWPLVWVI